MGSVDCSGADFGGLLYIFLKNLGGKSFLKKVSLVLKYPVAQDKIEEVRDHCQCLETSQCPEEKIDVYFGKACQTPGTVRCCDHIQKREEIPQKPIGKSNF